MIPIKCKVVSSIHEGIWYNVARGEVTKKEAKNRAFQN